VGAGGGGGGGGGGGRRPPPPPPPPPPAAPAPRALTPGDELWHRVYDGGADHADGANAEALSPDGRALYVVGSAVLAGHTDSDFTVVKYTYSGHRRWVRTYDGPVSGDDRAYAVAVDAQGFVYVGGAIHTVNSDDFVLIKYDAAGHRKWVRSYDGPFNGPDKVNALALGSRGSIYVAGNSYGLSGMVEGAVARYDSNGVQRWVKRYASSDQMGDEFTMIGVDRRRGAVYVGGMSLDATNGTDWLLIKYLSSGSRKWVGTYGNPGIVDVPRALAVAPDGSIYQAGYFTLQIPPGWQAVLTKWTPGGWHAWANDAVEGGLNGGDDTFLDVAVDSYGHVHAVGKVMNSGGDYDAIMATRTANGTYRATCSFDITGQNDLFRAVACDAAGNIFAAGWTDDLSVNNLGPQYLTVRYTHKRNLRWWATTDETWATCSDFAEDVVARSGVRPGVYVTGLGADAANVSDFFTVKYKP